MTNYGYTKAMAQHNNTNVYLICIYGGNIIANIEQKFKQNITKE
jgi:hypothetical protein